MIFQKDHLKYLIIILITLSGGCKKKNLNENFDKFLGEVKFNEIEYDFGALKEGEKAIHSFEFLNTGKHPVIIKEVKSSCGCTVPDYNKKPIEPGKRGKITIKYDTKRIGKFYKTITIHLNTPNSPIILIIKGEVIPSEVAAAKIN